MESFMEPLFGQDSFDKPKVIKDSDVIIYCLLTILFGKPGFYPSIPELGIYIQQYRYVNIDALDTEELKLKLAYQCEIIQDGIISGEIDVVKKKLANGDLALGIIIPIQQNDDKTKVLVGVRYSEDGIGYNYDLLEASESI